MITTEEYKKKTQALIKKIQTIAFIIAAIVVVVGVYTSIHKEEITKEEQLEEQLEEQQLEERESEQVEEQEEQVEEEVSPEEVTPSVKIESATAVPTRCYKGIQGEDTGCECTVEIFGTATLPITEGEGGIWYGDLFPLRVLTRDPLTPESYSWGIAGGSLTCPNWYSVDRLKCVRTRGQPATGGWSITGWSRFDPSPKNSITYFAVVYSDSRLKPIGVWDSVTLTCSR